MNDGSGDNCEIVDKTKLIVNYIPQGTTEKDLALIFSQIGMIESVRIMKNYKTGYSYGYGFVKYFNANDSAKAIESINGLNYRSKRLKVSYSRPPGHAMKDSNLYISNLPKDFSERDLEQLFSAFGEIIQKNVLKDKHSGLPRGVAFVRFSKGEEAQEAIANLHGKRLATSHLPLLVRVADDHSKQKAAMLLPVDIFKTNQLINTGYLTSPSNMRQPNLPPQLNPNSIISPLHCHHHHLHHNSRNNANSGNHGSLNTSNMCGFASSNAPGGVAMSNTSNYRGNNWHSHFNSQCRISGSSNGPGVGGGSSNAQGAGGTSFNQVQTNATSQNQNNGNNVRNSATIEVIPVVGGNSGGGDSKYTPQNFW